MRTRGGHSSSRDAFASTSSTSSPWGPRPSPASRRRSTGECSPTTPSTPSKRPTTRRPPSGRWRCSARSTATTCAWSRWGTTPRSSAAARTCTTPVGSAKLVVLKRDGRSVDELRKLAITLRDRLASAVVALGTALDGKANLVVAVSRDLVQRGVSAQDLVAPGAARLGGRGGGKPDLVVGGGTQVAELDAALDAVRQSAQAALEGAG